MGINSETMRQRHATPPTTGTTHPARIMAYIITGVLALLAIHQIVGYIVSWGQITLDDIQYGRPRMTRVSGVVGHNDSVHAPTHVMALNVQRQIVVLELPGAIARWAKPTQT